MSYFSSLVLIFPGKPPNVSGAQLRKFAEELRKVTGVKTESPANLSLKWGGRIDRNRRDIAEIDWGAHGLVEKIKAIFKPPGANIGYMVPFPWDLERNRKPWHELWDQADDSRRIYRAYVNLGNLAVEVTQRMMASPPDGRGGGTYGGIYPDSVVIEVNPVCPNTLNETYETCRGFLSVQFPGNGYFTWGRSMGEYAAQYADVVAVREALRICRKHFPVGSMPKFDKMVEPLGDLFLNRSYYQEGDWILSIAETG